MTGKRKNARRQEYDVCLSFAKQDRKYVSLVASHLQSNGIRTFFDEYEQVVLWGKDLYQHLDDVYRNAARYCILFVSKHYAKRLWTNHERKSAQARAFSENREYILPARFDDTSIPGLLPTVGYIDLRELSPKQFADLIAKKVGVLHRQFYLPPVPDRLFASLHLKSERRTSYALEQARSFVEALERMSAIERRIVAYVFLYGCPTDLPSNIHIQIDWLRRVSGLPASKCIRELTGLSSVGFRTKLSNRKDHGGDPLLKLSFDVRSVDYDGPDDTTGTVSKMVDCLREDYCPECALEAIMKGDFSALATATKKPEKHIRPRK